MSFYYKNNSHEDLKPKRSSIIAMFKYHALSHSNSWILDIQKIERCSVLLGNTIIFIILSKSFNSPPDS